jgi:hypothetical protein
VLTISGGGGTGAAATAIMNLSVTGYAVTTAGAGYTAAAGTVTISANPIVTPGGAPAYLNPSSQAGFSRPRFARISAPTSGAGGILVGGAVLDGGSYETVPVPGAISILAGSGLVTAAAVVTLTMGGNADTNYLNPQ